MNKFGFAYATHRVGTLNTVEDTTLYENGLLNIVPRIGDIRAKVMAEIDFFSKLEVDQVCANPKEGVEGG